MIVVILLWEQTGGAGMVCPAMSSFGPQFSGSPNGAATRPKARLQPDPKAPLRAQMPGASSDLVSGQVASLVVLPSPHEAGGGVAVGAGALVAAEGAHAEPQLRAAGQ